MSTLNCDIDIRGMEDTSSVNHFESWKMVSELRLDRASDLLFTAFDVFAHPYLCIARLTKSFWAGCLSYMKLR